MEFIKTKYKTIYNKKNTFIGYYIEKKKLYVYAKYKQYLSTFFISIDDLVAITTKGHTEQVYFTVKDLNEILLVRTPNIESTRKLINDILNDIHNFKDRTVNNTMIVEV